MNSVDGRWSYLVYLTFSRNKPGGFYASSFTSYCCLPAFSARLSRMERNACLLDGFLFSLPPLLVPDVCLTTTVETLDMTELFLPDFGIPCIAS